MITGIDSQRMSVEWRRLHGERMGNGPWMITKGMTLPHAKRKTLKNGSTRYYARYLGSDGKWHEEGGYPTKREAEKVAHQREVEAERGEWVDPTSSKMTFAKFIESTYWPAAQRLEATTRAGYRSYLDKHFLPAFGHLPMRRVAPGNIQTWVNTAGTQLSPRSVVKYHTLLHSIFALAVEHRVVAHNPCAHTRLPKVVQKPRRIITPDEFDSLLAAIDVRYQTMVLLEIETGLRWGELIALRPCDLDLTARTVHVHRTIVEVSKKISPTGERVFVKDYPKDNEPRIVQIEPGTCQILREHMLAYNVRNDDLMFTSNNSTAISRNNFRGRVWLPALEVAEIQVSVTFHGLRAAHASWLLAGGADLQVVKERLGHRQIATTQQYLGTLPDSGDRALAAFRKIRNRG
jgi:integrase